MIWFLFYCPKYFLICTVLLDVLKKGVKAILDGSSGFTIGSSSAENALKTAKELSSWLEVSSNQATAKEVGKKLVLGLKNCLSFR